MVGVEETDDVAEFVGDEDNDCGGDRVGDRVEDDVLVGVGATDGVKDEVTDGVTDEVLDGVTD